MKFFWMGSNPSYSKFHLLCGASKIFLPHPYDGYGPPFPRFGNRFDFWANPVFRLCEHVEFHLVGWRPMCVLLVGFRPNVSRRGAICGRLLIFNGGSNVSPMFTRQSDVRKRFGATNYNLQLPNSFILTNMKKTESWLIHVWTHTDTRA